MRQAGAKDYETYSKTILKTCKNKPISFEVFADTESEMIKQGIKINSWGKNVYVKIPSSEFKNSIYRQSYKKFK
jgi:transaldolase